jgi:hypothetical protein
MTNPKTKKELAECICPGLQPEKIERLPTPDELMSDEAQTTPKEWADEWLYSDKHADKTGKAFRDAFSYTIQTEHGKGSHSFMENARPCFCVGPQNGEPKCPCMMKDVIVRNGRYIQREVDLGPAN